MSRATGRFIVLEGIDGSGTTTQAARLVALLRCRGARGGGHARTLGRAARGGAEAGVDAAAGGTLGPGAGAALRGGPAGPPGVAGGAGARGREGGGLGPLRPLVAGVPGDADAAQLGGGAERGGPARGPDAVPCGGSRTAARRRQGRGGAAELFDADEVQRAVARAYARVVRKHARAQRVVRVDGRASPDEVAREIFSRVRTVLPGAAGSRPPGRAPARVSFAR